MKLWWVYAGTTYYPSIGLGDLRDTFEEEWQANLYAKELEGKHDWVCVINVANEVGEKEDSYRWQDSGC